MENENFTHRWIGRFRILTLALIFSGALNIALIATIAVFLGQESKSNLEISSLAPPRKEEKLSNAVYLNSLAKLHFRELVAQLTNRDLIEDGYTKRDLALTWLVSCHFFDLEKALDGAPIQRRRLRLSEEKTVELYPGLSEEQYEAVVRYAYQEKWPFTPKGLFAFLQRQSSPRDESLTQAFALTPEFYALTVLFQKSGSPHEEATLIQLACEGTWDLLERFSREQAQMLDLSPDKRRALLLGYLAFRSPTAAALLLRTDFDFALKSLNDRGILDLLALQQVKNEEAVRFCTELLKSSRSDAVWEKSAQLLYQFSGEAVPEPFDRSAALSRFVPRQSVPAAPVVAVPTVSASKTPALKRGAIHIVKEGDTLWKIARQYKVKVDELAAVNKDSGKLRPGMELVIP